MTTEMPWAVGIRFAHASLQVIADEHSVHLLHIKGPAVDRSLWHLDDVDGAVTEAAEARSVPRRSVDADVLVRPSHVQTMVDAMRRHDWSTTFRFEDGSAFEHAATMGHAFLAPVDVHRRFPGIGLDPEAAFERMWTDRHTTLLAGYPCWVPSVTAQRLVLLLHAARGGVADHPDIRRSWLDAPDGVREEVERLAVELRAEVGLAAASGRLDEFRGRREHDLWAALSSGETSLLRIWAARVRAAPTRRDAARTALLLLVPNPRRLATSLGRPPTRREVAAAYLQRARWGMHEIVRSVRARSGGPPR